MTQIASSSPIANAKVRIRNKRFHPFAESGFVMSKTAGLSLFMISPFLFLNVVWTTSMDQVQ